MQKNGLTCAEIRWMDLVDYLSSLGHQAQKIRGQDYWYLSPFREEKHPSFKINRKLNLWYDHGMGRGGNFMDFSLPYYHCSIPQFLQKLSQERTLFSFHPPQNPEVKAGLHKENKIQILDVKPMQSIPLKVYLNDRKIPLSIANRYCKEVLFELNGKSYRAVGFPNQVGGYELRDPYFKGSSTPKSITFLNPEKSHSLSVFEGFFSFLSYQTILEKERKKMLPKLTEVQSSFLILNSLSFFEKSRSVMEKHEHIHLYLDRDKAGMDWTQQALSWSGQYQDHSHLYQKHKDLNDYLIQSYGHQQQQRFQRRRHFGM